MDINFLLSTMNNLMKKVANGEYAEWKLTADSAQNMNFRGVSAATGEVESVCLNTINPPALDCAENKRFSAMNKRRVQLREILSRPGGAKPTNAELAKQFGVSTTMIWKDIRWLRDNGFITD